MWRFFETEINRIVSEDLRMFVKFFLENYVPAYFWEIGASSSGKYHPKFSQGYGGLVRHTKAACLFLEDLLRMSSYAYMGEEKHDLCRVALILHDTAKYGLGEEMDKTQYKYHAINAAKQVAVAWYEYFNTDAPYLLTQAIRSHMGQWSEKEDRPFTQIDRAVHMADYMSSRSYIDIPEISEEWDEVYHAINGHYLEDDDLPF